MTDPTPPAPAATPFEQLGYVIVYAIVSSLIAAILFEAYALFK